MYLNKDILNRIINKKEQLDSFRPLPKSILNKLREQFIIEWTYNSNAIEGNTLTLRETALVLQEGLTVKGKTLTEHTEATNHKDAIEYIEILIKQNIPFNQKTLLKIHEIILTNIDKDFAGAYRNQNVRILGARTIPPNPIKIPSLIKSYFAWIKKNKNLHIIELAALAHYKLAEIHPFIDGNGRTARLIMNLLLMQKGFPPAIILKQDRPKYYNTLNQANLGQLNPFILFIAQATERSLGLYLDAIEPKTSKKQSELTEYLSLQKASKDFPYSQEYLSLLARQGKIHAIKKGRNWLTTKEAINKYIKNRKRKR